MLVLAKLDDEIQSVQREMKAKRRVPVPPDAFTLFCQATIAERGIRGNQQDINKALARLWSAEQTSHHDDGPAIIPIGTQDSKEAYFLEQDHQLWAEYTKTLDFKEPLNSAIEVLDNLGFNYGWYFFRFASNKVLHGLRSDLLLWSIWTTMPCQEKRIYEMRGRRAAEIAARSKGGVVDGDRLEGLDEFFSFLPMSTYTRVGTRAREHWGV